MQQFAEQATIYRSGLASGIREAGDAQSDQAEYFIEPRSRRGADSACARTSSKRRHGIARSGQTPDRFRASAAHAGSARRLRRCAARVQHVLDSRRGHSGEIGCADARPCRDDSGGGGRVIGAQFSHPQWHGFTFYDLIFPLFIFVTGVAIVFSLTRLVEREGRSAAHGACARAFACSSALGVICYGGVSERLAGRPAPRRAQRIALCYCSRRSCSSTFVCRHGSSRSSRSSRDTGR